MKRLRLLLFAVLVALVATELVLQVGYLAVWALGSRHESSATTASGPVILCLGDSFTYGMGSSSPAKSYPAQLEQRLRADGLEVRVENRGWPGRNSREVLEALDGLLVTLQPEVVCITVGVNDSWTRPERLQLPAALPSAADVTSTGREYVWTFRTWRLLQTFRARNPFRDQRTADSGGDAAGAETEEPAVVVGRWRAAGADFRCTLDKGGTGKLGPNDMRWSVRGEHITFTPEGAPPIAGTWRLDEGVLLLSWADQQVRLIREDIVEKPASPVADGHQAMAASDWAGALAAFEKSIQAAKPGDASLPGLHAALAQCYQALGRSEEARAELATVRTFAAERGDIGAKEALATALTACGHVEEADAATEQAIAAGSRTPSLWVQYAQLVEKRGDIDAARNAIDTAIELAVAAQWNPMAVLYRTKARLSRNSTDFVGYAGAIVDAHMLDGNRGLTRQQLGNWQAPTEARVAAMQRACADRKLTDDDARTLLTLLRETMGEGTEAWHQTLRDHLQQAIRRCREVGAKPVLGTHPLVVGYREMLRQLAEDEGVPLVENDMAFAGIRTKEPGRVLNVADGHCNDDGYGVMAQGFAAAIRGLLAAGRR